MMWQIILSLILGSLVCLLQLIRKPRSLWETKSMGSHGEGSRDLGEMEKGLASWGEHGYYQCCVALFLCSKSPITEDIMRNALSALATRHPGLRMRLGRENGILTYMKEMKDFKVDLEVDNSNDWKEVMEAELLDVINSEKGPLWRVKLLPSVIYEKENIDYPHQIGCVFTFHHTVGDGVSSGRLVYDLLSIIETIMDGKVPTPKPLPLLPPIDAYLELSQKYSFLNNLKNNLLIMAYSIPIFRQILEKVSSSETLVFKKSLSVEIKRNSDAPLKTCILPFELSSDQTSKLIASCKRHKVTINSALQTACAMAYCSLADSGKLKQVYKLKVANGYSLLDPSAPNDLKQSLGVFASSFPVEIKIDPHLSFWQHVKETNTRTLASLTTQKKENATSEILKLKYSKSYNLGKKFQGERTLDLFVSNIGNLAFLRRDEKSNIACNGMFYALAHHATGHVFRNVMGTFNGKLLWTLSYCPHAISKTFAQSFMDLTLEMLFSAVDK